MFLVPLTEDFIHASLEKVRQRSAHWIGNSWASLGVFSHDSAKRPHGAHQCEQVGRSMWAATASILNEQSLSLPPSSSLKSGREWFILSEASTWPWALSSSWFSQIIFTVLSQHRLKTIFFSSSALQDKLHDPFPPWSLSPWTVKRWSSQENRRLAWSSNWTVLFSCVDISRLSVLSHNGKGTVWMELTWAWKTRVRVKGHQSSWTRGSGRPCPSSPFPLPC